MTIRRFLRFGVHDGSVGVEAQHQPRALVMVAGPAAVEDVGVAEEAVERRRRRTCLPVFGVVARATEHDHARDLLVHREARGGSGAVRGAADDDLGPVEFFAARGEELLPAALRVLLHEPLHHARGTSLGGIRFGDLDGLRGVDASGGFEADVAEVLGVGGHGVELAEPTAGVGDADMVVAVAVHLFGDDRVMAHQPDHQLAARGDARVDIGRLRVGGLALALQSELDVGIRLRGRVDLAGAHREVVSLGLRVVELHRGSVDKGGDEAEGQIGEDGTHGVAF